MSDRPESHALSRKAGRADANADAGANAGSGAGGSCHAPLRLLGQGPPQGRTRRGLLAAALLAAGPVATGAADPLPAPTDAPILTVSGSIRTTGRGCAAFDRAALHALGMATITTRTPWYDGPVRFDGVPMARLLNAVGAEGTTVTAIALNEYSMDIPIGDFTRFPVLLATTRNGMPMRVSERGPLFIVYPYDSDPVLRSSLYYGRSVWSVAQLVVR